MSTRGRCGTEWWSLEMAAVQNHCSLIHSLFLLQAPFLFHISDFEKLNGALFAFSSFLSSLSVHVPFKHGGKGCVYFF